MDQQPVNASSPNWPQIVGLAGRQGWIVLVAAGVAAVIGFAWSQIQTPQNRSSAVISLNPISDDLGRAPATEAAVAEQIDILMSSTTAERVVADIGLPVRAEFKHNTLDTTNIRITGCSGRFVPRFMPSGPLTVDCSV
jgi:uncharacterized protein involved in exopolysaccharide biosynthesis